MKKVLLLLIMVINIYNVYSVNVTEDCIEFIKLHESCKLYLYKDANTYSIGYGHHFLDKKHFEEFLNEYNIKLDQGIIDTLFISPLMKYSENIGSHTISVDVKCDSAVYLRQKSILNSKCIVITKEAAEELLVKDINIACNYTDKLIKKLPYKYNFPQSFINGFVSYVYNVGYGKARKSEFYKNLARCHVFNNKMHKEDIRTTVKSIKDSYATSPGHKKRRNGEYDFMIKDF